MGFHIQGGDWSPGFNGAYVRGARLLDCHARKSADENQEIGNSALLETSFLSIHLEGVSPPRKPKTFCSITWQARTGVCRMMCFWALVRCFGPFFAYFWGSASKSEPSFFDDRRKPWPESRSCSWPGSAARPANLP